MDDSAIEKIRREVLGRLSGTPEERMVSSLESRVAALEVAIGEIRDAVGRSATAPRGQPHPSLVVLSVPAGADAKGPESGRCLLEPDKPCVHSGACRVFGH